MSDISSDRIKELLSDPKNLDKIAAMVGSMSGGGLSALLSMLNSCANGVGIVNIDNGFGAGYLASTINSINTEK